MRCKPRHMHVCLDPFHRENICLAQGRRYGRTSLAPDAPENFSVELIEPVIPFPVFDHFEDFSTQTLNELPDGFQIWCNPDSWLVVDTENIGGVGGRSLRLLTSSGHRSRLLRWLALGDFTNHEVTARVRYIAPTGALNAISIHMNDGIRADVTPTAVRRSTMFSCNSTLQDTEPFVPPEEEWFYLKFAFFGGLYRTKAWTGDVWDEPEGWVLEHAHTPTRHPGWIGLSGFAGDGREYFFDWIGVNVLD